MQIQNRQLKSLLHVYRSSILLRASLWYTVGRFALRGLSFGAIFVFSRLLTPEEYGTVAIFLTWVALFSTILTLNLSAAVGRGYFDFKGLIFEYFASSVLFLCLIAAGLGFVVLLVLPAPFIEKIFSLPKDLILLAALASFFVEILDFTQRIWQVKDHFGNFVKLDLFVEIAVFAFSVGLVILPVWSNTPIGAAMGRLLAFTVVNVITGILLMLRQLRRAHFNINKVYWRYALVYAVPILPHVISNVLLNQFDRVMIDAYIGRSEAGIYSFAYQLGAIISMIWVAINNAWVPWFYRRMEKNDASVILLRSRQYLWGFTVMTIGLIIVTQPVTLLIAPPKYLTATRIIPIVMGGGFFQMLYSFALATETYYKKTMYVSLGTIFAGVINVVLNLVFIPQYGIMAAAWATLIAYIFLFLIHTAFVHFQLKVRDLFPLTQMFVLGIVVTIIIILWSVLGG